MGTTSKGYPYPEGTDLVMDGDDAIKALAEAINTKLPYASSSGTVNVVSAANAETASVTVTFQAGLFSAAPAVVGTTTLSILNVSTSGTGTASSTQLTVRRVDGVALTGGTYPVMWIAQQAIGALMIATLAAGAESDVTVTCPTAGCPNVGIPIPISSTWQDGDDVYPVTDVICGVCGTDITDTMTPIEGA